MKRIPLTNGGHALVDNEDFDRVSAFRWRRMNKENYAVRGVYDPATKNTRNILMHRVIMCSAADEEIDHKNHKRLDNQKHNLRRATRTQNNGNAKGWSKPTSSKFKGVTWHTGGQKWMARVGGKYLGLFTDEAKAAAAYNAAALKYFKEFSLLNKIT